MRRYVNFAANETKYNSLNNFKTLHFSLLRTRFETSKRRLVTFFSLIFLVKCFIKQPTNETKHINKNYSILFSCRYYFLNFQRAQNNSNKTFLVLVFLHFSEYRGRQPEKCWFLRLFVFFIFLENIFAAKINFAKNWVEWVTCIGCSFIHRVKLENNIIVLNYLQRFF